MYYMLYVWILNMWIVGDIFEIATKFDVDDLKQICIRTIKKKPLGMLRSDCFFSCCREIVKEILQFDKIKIQY